MFDLQTRRTFLRAAMAAGAAWAAADLGQVEEALAWSAGQSASGAAATSALTKAQAEVVDAMASRILPAVDGRAGRTRPAPSTSSIARWRRSTRPERPVYTAASPT